MPQLHLFPALEYQLNAYTASDVPSLSALLQGGKVMGIGVMSGRRTSQELLERFMVYSQRNAYPDEYYALHRGDVAVGFAVISAHRSIPALEFAFLSSSQSAGAGYVRKILLEEVRKYNSRMVTL